MSTLYNSPFCLIRDFIQLQCTLIFMYCRSCAAVTPEEPAVLSAV
ncbi:unnamed protein product [Ixodes pacificus]